MTLWHIDDFATLMDEVPRPWPWTVIGVLPTTNEYLEIGSIAYDRNHAFCYTVSAGPTEVWCPMLSVEGRFGAPELITVVINHIFTAYGTMLEHGDNLLVPLGYTDNDETHDGVFWIGTAEEDPDGRKYHCYQSPHPWVLPVAWSSPLGWPE